MKAGLLVDRIYITLLRKIFNEYLHEFNYDDFRLVKEECCADEGNAYWVCSNEFFKLASILTEENSLFEAYSPEEALLLFQELYQLILQIWDIFFTSFSFQFASYVNFIFTEILFVTVTFTLLLWAGQLIETISSRAENVFTKILLHSKYDFDQENVSVQRG